MTTILLSLTLLKATSTKIAPDNVEESSSQAAIKTTVTKPIEAQDTSKTYTMAEVKHHDANAERPWVTYGNSVYDITDFVAIHPGGAIILQAAGGSIELYWRLFAVHKQNYVEEILNQYKIGHIDPADLVEGKIPCASIRDPFSEDPKRDAQLRILTDRPCCAETPNEALHSFLTPNNLFYIRHHFWVPTESPRDYRLTVEVEDGSSKTYTLTDLRSKFAPHKITATLQCAGNRRTHMSNAVRKTNGLPWDIGGISTAEWEGIKLSDLLKDAGITTPNPTCSSKHAQFSALEAYGASIPLGKAIDPHGDVLLAYKMNGKDLPPDHGSPLRVVVPGTVAARSVKWVNKITISDEESPAQWQRKDYRCFGPNIGNKPDWDTAPSIQEMPVMSAITKARLRKPTRTSFFGTGEDNVQTDMVDVQGYAYSGGGRGIIRVDISLDGGKSWDQAELLDSERSTTGGRSWAWMRWKYAAEMPKGLGDGVVEVVVKATDEAYNTQPERFEGIWNARGNLANAWHRVGLRRE